MFLYSKVIVMNSTVNPIIPLNSSNVSLLRSGGKGKSLAKLASADLPVPSGFILSTDAYQEFVEVNRLQQRIQDIVDRTDDQAQVADKAATDIHLLFAAAEIPAGIAQTIKQAYTDLIGGEQAVAVRSSATAEDLPELSFAGQQDSFLNVKGESALLEAIRNCWASLWTTRATRYREQHDIDHRDVAMAVVVQSMVQADVSGVLFTVNPANGDRSEIIINASFGLGEAIVAGQVTPDTYILDRNSLKAKQTIIGAKENMAVAQGELGTDIQAVPEELRDKSSLSDELLAELATLSLQAEQLFEDVPQDIEWAVANEKCHLLQSRPITSLPTAPLLDVQWNPPSEKIRLVRRQVVENMPEPLSPLFEDLYLEAGLDHAIEKFLFELGVPFDIDDFIERPMFRTVNGYAYCMASYKIGWRVLAKVPKILYWYITNLSKMLRNMVPEWRDEALPAYLETIEHWRALDLSTASDEELLAGIRSLSFADGIYWFYTSVVMGMAKVTDGLLHYFLTSRAVHGQLTSGMFLRGFPSKTLEAQKELESIAKRINAIAGLSDLVLEVPVADLTEVLGKHADGDAVVIELEHYLNRYGHQVYNLDFVQATQAEEPLPVLLSLKTLAENTEYDSGLLQQQNIKERENLLNQTLQSLGPIRRWLFRKFLGWAQFYGPNREEALFYMGAAWPTVRWIAFELGERLAAVGTIGKRDDVFYLTSEELIEAATARHEHKALGDMAQLADSRRELRESRQQLHPPPMVPEKSRFKFGPFDLSAWETQKRNADDRDTMNGFAVSPGKVTGTASVILSPSDFEKMEPNTILVCATTTPAWTPLFSQAQALVTDIGGMLAHGSIVAREYGIPAVMGTGSITQRIVSGQKIMVDGNTGTVTILN